MPIKLIANKPVPTVQPPTTYDLIGLSAADIRMIRTLLSIVGTESFAPSHSFICRAIDTLVPDNSYYFDRVVDINGDIVKSVNIVRR